MPGFTVKLEGFDEVIKSLDIKQLEPDISAELAAFGQDVATDAKQLVPVDEGFLKNSINSVPSSLKVEIVVNADYAAYVEFGTRKFAASYVAGLPADWQEFASTFRGGGGGSFAEMLIRITAWVKRKGIAAAITKSGKPSKSKSSEAAQNQAAYLIARSILINGIKAQPYLFPAFEKNRPLLLERLKNLFKK